MTFLSEELQIHRASSIDEIDVRTFYRIAQLRERVFVVEQECPYLELDGRDLEGDAVQLWAATADGEIAATIRVLTGATAHTQHTEQPQQPQRSEKPEKAEQSENSEKPEKAEQSENSAQAQSASQSPSDLRIIGRVVTSPAWRGKGVAAALMQAAVAECPGQAIELDAQAHLTAWYGRFGFAVAGEEFLEDGIPHIRMRREAA